MPFRTRMITDAPTPALPVPIAMLPDARFSLLAVSVAPMSILPPAWTFAYWSTYALTAWVPPPFRTTTRIEPATPAPSEAPPATTSSKRSSLEVALIAMSPPADTTAYLPM